jgi:hypothetical protein
VWQGKRRMAELEKEVAQARAAQAALQQRVNLFERIAAAAGASLSEATPGAAEAAAGGPGGGAAAGGSPGEPLPPTLLAAATRGQAAGAPVRLEVGGQDVIAVIGDDEGGDPREWWNAIHRLTAQLRSAS